MRADGSIVTLCARQELVLAIRSRWTQLFAAVFAVLSLAVAASGYVLSGGSGLQDFSRTAASLLQLVLLIVPLASLVMGLLALTPERGGAELLYAQPVSRAAVLLGACIGLFAALVAAQMVGFGAAGVVIFWQTGADGVAGYALVVLASVMLTAIFLSLAALVSIGQTGRRRARALAIALALWFGLALVFDIAVLGAATLLRSGDASRLLIVSALINPIDAARTGAFLGIEGTGAFGPASLALLRFTHGAPAAAVLIAGSLIGWIVIPLYGAMRRLTQIDIL